MCGADARRKMQTLTTAPAFVSKLMQNDRRSRFAFNRARVGRCFKPTRRRAHIAVDIPLVDGVVGHVGVEVPDPDGVVGAAGDEGPGRQDRLQAVHLRVCLDAPDAGRVVQERVRLAHLPGRDITVR